MLRMSTPSTGPSEVGPGDCTQVTSPSLSFTHLSEAGGCRQQVGGASPPGLVFPCKEPSPARARVMERQPGDRGRRATGPSAQVGWGPRDSICAQKSPGRMLSRCVLEADSCSSTVEDEVGWEELGCEKGSQAPWVAGVSRLDPERPGVGPAHTLPLGSRPCLQLRRRTQWKQQVSAWGTPSASAPGGLLSDPRFRPQRPRLSYKEAGKGWGSQP